MLVVVVVPQADADARRAELLAQYVERYDLAGTYSMLTDGLMRYVTRQREKR